MKEKSLIKLEFHKIKEEVKSGAVSGAGKELVESLHPHASRTEALRALNETNEAVKLMDLKGSPPFEGLYDVREGISRAGKGSVLTPGVLLRISNLLRSCRLMVKYLKTDGMDPKALLDLASGITILTQLEDEIALAIIGEEEISDHASPKLASIRRAFKEKSASVKDRIQSLVRSNGKYLQDALYTIRGDRYVLPVKAEHKNAVPGLVHDQSSSGQTLFIEPMSLVTLNNEIKELLLKEKAEIERILRELSAKVTEQYGPVLRNSEIIYRFDAIFAMGKYAVKTDSTCPAVKEDGSFNLISARHPLIDPKQVVASTIYLGEKFTSLVITGPNTGGKTVTLKTVGLLHAMALSGLLIPVNDNSHVSFFKEIYADIGDEQSIEQSLSTFSSHMTNIVRIMEHADETSLVLFDELGAGTDPTEGAALAIAILEELRSRQTRVIATTHYSELKAYALRTEGVENASVEFDVDSLRPTFRLLIGVPGKSNAFLISKRLGLSDDIIEKSRSLISSDSLKFEDLIENLQISNITAKEDALKSRSIRRDLEEKQKDLDEKLRRIDALREKQLNDAKQQARAFLNDVKDEADEILKALRKLEASGGNTGLRQELESTRQRLRDAMEIVEDTGGEPTETDTAPDLKLIAKIKPGMEFMHGGIGQRVSVLSYPDDKGNLMVQAGIIKLSANVADLKVSKEMTRDVKKRKKEVHLNLKTVPISIDLRGLDAEEAAYRADQYLDEAAQAGLNEVTIIHGVGTGVLKKRISELLRNHPHVKTHRRGEYGEGGMGVTMVEVK